LGNHEQVKEPAEFLKEKYKLTHLSTGAYFSDTI
jgi:adenylate kinase family enzyme